jgi:hypothetical protein
VSVCYKHKYVERVKTRKKCCLLRIFNYAPIKINPGGGVRVWAMGRDLTRNWVSQMPAGGAF